MAINKICTILLPVNSESTSRLKIFSIRIILFYLFFLWIGYGEYLQTILVQPRSVEVPVGATVILDCTVFNQYGEVAW